MTTNTTTAARPARPTEYQLKKVGVTIAPSNSAFWLKCDNCGSLWSPNTQPGGKLPRGYWKCEKGCNHER